MTPATENLPLVDKKKTPWAWGRVALGVAAALAVSALAAASSETKLSSTLRGHAAPPVNLAEETGSLGGSKLGDGIFDNKTKVEKFASGKQVQQLKDISGMSYIGQGAFVVAHDMKANENKTLPCVSLVQLPFDLDIGLMWAPLTNDLINWPEDRELCVKCKKKGIDPATASPDYFGIGSNDLESIAGIPGTITEKGALVLLCESTNSKEDIPTADRIYLAAVERSPAGGGIRILGVTEWSTFTDSENVEGTAVAALADGSYLFLWGERDGSKPGEANTSPKDGDPLEIHWASLSFVFYAGAPVGLIIGDDADARGVGTFKLPEDGSLNWSGRPIVGLDVDEVTGDIYLVSSADLEGKNLDPLPDNVDADNGPYRGAVSTIGNVDLGTGSVTIYPYPQKVLHQDGFKTEAVARAQDIPRGDGATPHDFATFQPATFLGSDDENYGGTIRQLPEL